ncbi:MAG TPA: glycosyltransferase family 1 protein [Solirubrobacteraceae bacterium]|jgi:glycosyltransferase involved in cell wall biosynthesis|nr:glycosyltransferase family 1 protein [Solirubrobacteraceae bacterium]
MPRPRSVLLNALYLAPNASGGPETYLRGLAPALAREFPDLRISIASTTSGAAALRADGWEEFARLISLPCEDGQRLRRQWAEQVLLPRTARGEGVDIVHSLASVAPVYAGARSVVTLHDLTFLQMPTFGRVTTWGMALVVRLAARRADALIAVSTAARDQICTQFHLDPARFAVVHHGFQPKAGVPATPGAEIRAGYGLGDARIVLCVAAKRPHKNQELLLRAAALLDPDVVIVLVGHPEPYELKLRELARELDLGGRVRFEGYVSDADLECLWTVASCAAFPTLGEGFGMPVLEALAHGIPVAGSRLPVLEEVGGTLLHYFDPRDPADAARAIDRALIDRDAARLGPAHAAAFTWASAARATNAAYERALALRPR